MSSAPAVLYGFWASSCSWRVRAALRFKNIAFIEKEVDIVDAKTQLTEQYRALNPTRKVPALLIDGDTLVESMAILQYLEDTRPQPSLEPSSPRLRCKMREIVEVIVSGIQPLQNVGLKPLFDTEEQFQKFAQYHAQRGLETLEMMLARTSGTHCVGNELTFADLCFVPQIYNSVGRLKLDISHFSNISRLYSYLTREDIFVETNPKKIKAEKFTHPV